MVQAWYMDNSQDDPQKELHLIPPQMVSIDNLYSLSKVEHWKIDADNLENDKIYSSIKQQRGYNYEDVVEISRDKLTDYDAKIKAFYSEHLHEYEEIRIILAGCGYFDVRDITDKWIRIKVEKGDMLVLPAGIYHRFTPDEKNYTKAMRVFCGPPIWEPHNRPSDDKPCRQKYLQDMKEMLQEIQSSS